MQPKAMYDDDSRGLNAPAHDASIARRDSGPDVVGELYCAVCDTACATPTELFDEHAECGREEGGHRVVADGGHDVADDPVRVLEGTTVVTDDDGVRTKHEDVTAKLYAGGWLAIEGRIGEHTVIPRERIEEVYRPL